MKRFILGMISGIALMLVLFVAVAVLISSREREKEATRYEEMMDEVRELEEVYRGADDDVLLDMPGVRGAADGARDGFYRRLDEILQRYGSESSD
jgi:hypothetical protein